MGEFYDWQPNLTRRYRHITSPAGALVGALGKHYYNKWTGPDESPPKKRAKIMQQKRTMPRRSRFRRKTPARRKYRRKYKKKYNKRRKGTERRMRGGRKLNLMTQIIPKETMVKLPMNVWTVIQKPVTSNGKNHWLASLSNSLYFPFEHVNAAGAIVDREQMVTGADAWSSFYRQYQVMGIKYKIMFERHNDAVEPNKLWPIVHVGDENRVSRNGTAHIENFHTHKNTRIGKPLYQNGMQQTTGGRKGNTWFNGYLSVRKCARDSQNKGSFSALTGLPATQGANNTDPDYKCFINMGIASDENFVDAAQSYGPLVCKFTYYVRFFDRKYFQTDIDGEVDEGTATQQTAVPVTQPVTS